MSRTSAGAKTLDARYYTSLDVYDVETAHIFGSSWLCVGRADEIPFAGDYLLYDLDGESLLVVRSSEDSINCFYNVCRHRGTRLCEQQQGNLRQTIRCAYHAWTYDLDGRLVGAPNMADVECFDKSAYALKRVATAVRAGFILINLSGSVLFSQAYESAFSRLALWQLESLASVKRISYDVQANWKLLFQNYNECYHCACVHPMLNLLTPSRSATNLLTQGPIVGGPMQIAEEATSLSTNGAACGTPLMAASSELRRQVHYYSVFPTMLISLHPDYVLVHRLLRQGIASTRVVCDFLFHPDDPARAGFDPQPAIEFWDVTNRQDWHVCELSQQGITSRAYEPGPYANQESLLVAFDRHYLGCLDAR